MVFDLPQVPKSYSVCTHNLMGEIHCTNNDKISCELFCLHR
jgi:hypothetical protein